LPIELSCAASKVTASLREDSDGLLAGLRAFRDHALKPVSAGRRWIQSYYGHSPELAMVLIQNPDARKAALVVVEHFSRLGRSELRRELGVLGEELRSLNGLSLGQAVRRAEIDAGKADVVLPLVRAHQLGEGSRKADWELIRKYLPKERGDNESSQKQSQ